MHHLSISFAAGLHVGTCFRAVEIRCDPCSTMMNMFQRGKRHPLTDVSQGNVCDRSHDRALCVLPVRLKPEGFDLRRRTDHDTSRWWHRTLRHEIATTKASRHAVLGCVHGRPCFRPLSALLRSPSPGASLFGGAASSHARYVRPKEAWRTSPAQRGNHGFRPLLFSAAQPYRQNVCVVSAIVLMTTIRLLLALYEDDGFWWCSEGLQGRCKRHFLFCAAPTRQRHI